MKKITAITNKDFRWKNKNGSENFLPTGSTVFIITDENFIKNEEVFIVLPKEKIKLSIPFTYLSTKFREAEFKLFLMDHNPIEIRLYGMEKWMEPSRVYNTFQGLPNSYDKGFKVLEISIHSTKISKKMVELTQLKPVF
jgi:hypothetical protein